MRVKCYNPKTKKEVTLEKSVAEKLAEKKVVRIIEEVKKPEPLTVKEPKKVKDKE